MIPFNELDWKVDQEDFIPNESKKDLGNILFKIQQSTGRKCIIKTFYLHEFDMKRLYDKEKSILASQHQAIVPFIGFYDKNDIGYIVMEDIRYIDLESFLKKHRKYYPDPLWDDTHKLIIAYGISSALKYLHEHQIVFEKLDPRNVLLDSELHPYLTIFGSLLRTFDNFMLDIHDFVSPKYVAPEVINEETNAKPFPYDVYAYGIILYELITELVPFQKFRSIFKIHQSVANGERPNLPENTPSN